MNTYPGIRTECASFGHFDPNLGQGWDVGGMDFYKPASALIGLQVLISANCPDHLYSSSWMCFQLVTLESATVAFLA